MDSWLSPVGAAFGGAIEVATSASCLNCWLNQELICAAVVGDQGVACIGQPFYRLPLYNVTLNEFAVQSLTADIACSLRHWRDARD